MTSHPAPPTDTIDPSVRRRDVLKKAGIAGGALVWAVPTVQAVSGGIAGAQGSTCPSCANVRDLDPGGGLGLPDVDVVADITGGCGPGCTISVTRVWTATSQVNITLNTGAASGTPGANTLAGLIGTCASAASARVTFTLTVSCTGGAGTVSSTCLRTEDVAWPAGCGNPGTGTLVTTNCPDQDGLTC